MSLTTAVLFLQLVMINCEKFANITYTTVGGTPLMMDIQTNDHINSSKSNPCLIQIHGGGWSGGSKNEVPSFVEHAGQTNGMVLASIDYRLTSQTGMYGNENVSFPAQIEDVRSAVKFLKSAEMVSKFNIDINRIGCWGESAGAHLCGLAGALFANSTENLTWAILYYAPTDLQDMQLDCYNDSGTNYNCTIEHDEPSSPESKLIFCDPTVENCYNPGIGQLRAHQTDQTGSWPYYEQLVNYANPINFVTKENIDKLPYFWISAGYNDSLVPYLQSIRMFDQLQAIRQNEKKYTMELCSCPNTSEYPKGCGHGANPSDCWDPINQNVTQWLGRWSTHNPEFRSD